MASLGRRSLPAMMVVFAAGLVAAGCGDEVMGEDGPIIDMAAGNEPVSRPDLRGPDIATMPPPDITMVDIAMADMATCMAACPNGCCDPQGIRPAPSLGPCG